MPCINPVSQPNAHLLPNKAIEGCDKTILLECGNELAWRYGRPIVLAPPCKGFGSHDFASRHVALGLKLEKDLATVQAMEEIDKYAIFPFASLAHIRLIDADALTEIRFCMRNRNKSLIKTIKPLFRRVNHAHAEYRREARRHAMACYCAAQIFEQAINCMPVKV